MFRTYQSEHSSHFRPLPKDYKEQFVDQAYQFIIPKTLWLYKQTGKAYIDSLYERNIRTYAKTSDFEVKFVDLSNLADYVPIAVFERVNQFIGFLKERAKNNQQAKLKETLGEIEKKIVLLNVLY